MGPDIPRYEVENTSAYFTSLLHIAIGLAFTRPGLESDRFTARGESNGGGQLERLSG